MKRHAKLHLHIGLRTFKTALAVTLALLLARAIGANSPMFAGLGAIVAMTRTLRDSLREARTQFAGIVVGGIISCILLLLFPVPSPWITGLAILAAIALCNFFGLYYAVSMTAIIVLSVCVSSEGNVLADMGYRLLDTTTGLIVGLLVNMLIKPYNNRHRVVAVLYRMAAAVPRYLDACMLKDLYPDLADFEKSLREMELEFEIYRRQHFRYRETHDRDAAYLSGVCQLATRMYQELSALCCMDTFGVPNARNMARLRELGLCVPEHWDRKCTEEDSIVSNYHLEKILDAREYLLILLEAG